MGSKQSQDGGYSATLCFYKSLNTNRLRNSLPNKYYNNQRSSGYSSNNSTTSIARPGPESTSSAVRNIESGSPFGTDLCNSGRQEHSEKEAFAAAPGCSSFAVLFLALTE